MKANKTPQKILIVGATSAMAVETAKLFAAKGAALMLAGRNANKLTQVADDLRVRGTGKISTCVWDVNDIEGCQGMINTAQQFLGDIDAVLVAHGTLPDQKRCEREVDYALNEFKTNATGTIALLTSLANYFENRKAGCITVITSVAGDRGRQSNYLYGTAKAAVNTFLQGLRNRLYKSGVRVLTIKPGFVDTPMTAHLPKNFLFATPETVAKGIYSAMVKQKTDVLYVPGFWRIIMWIVKLIPERIFKGMSL